MRGSKNVDAAVQHKHISTYTKHLISTVFLLYNRQMMKQTEGKLLLMRKITVAGVKPPLGKDTPG